MTFRAGSTGQIPRQAWSSSTQAMGAIMANDCLLHVDADHARDRRPLRRPATGVNGTALVAGASLTPWRLSGVMGA